MLRACVSRRWSLLALSIATLLVLSGCTSPTNDRLPQWLGFYNGKHTNRDYAIGISTADDPLTGFTRDTIHSPILPPPGYTHVAAPCVVFADGTFYMYVEGYDEFTASWSDVLLYTSDDGFHWTSSPFNPVLTRWGGARRCSVLYEPDDPGREFKMWYVRSDTLDIAYAASSDGVSWQTTDAPILTHGPLGSWDANHVMVGGIWKESDTYYLFYAGHDGVNYQGGYATATSPGGPYTKSLDNPIVHAEGAADQPLLASVRRGATRLTVADSSAFRAGQPVVLCSTRGTWEVNRIASVPSSMELEFVHQIAQTYSASENSHVRSWASQDVHSTCVWREDGDWNVVTCNFGLHKGVMGAVNFMIEITGYMTGSDLADLEWRYSASPLLGRTTSLDTTWDQCSRENMWVLRMPGREP